MSAWVLILVVEFSGRYAYPFVFSPPTPFTTKQKCDAFAELAKSEFNNSRSRVFDVHWRCVEVKP